MPSAALLQVERRLTALGGPSAELQRKIRELADHHDDLKHDALEEGLSNAEAEARADQLLGEPLVLAKHLAAALRQSSWWGRHPFIGFCLLPPFAIILLLSLGMWIEFMVGRLCFTEDQLGALANEQPGLGFCVSAVFGAYYLAIVFASVLFCVWARRTVTGFKWAGIACAICALHGAFFNIVLVPHNLSIGYLSHLHWPGTLIPLLVAFVFWRKLRKALNQLPPLPASHDPLHNEAIVPPPFAKTRFLNPTSVITMLIFAAIIWFILQVFLANRRGQFHRTDLTPIKSPTAATQTIAKV